MISPHSTNGPLLNVSDLHVRFKTDEGIILAVRGVSFELGRNVALGLVGESGCGKSVTALSIMRLVPDPPGRITGGSILWKGSDILSMPRRALPAFRGHDVAMIFQEPMTSLNPVFTIGRQLEEVIRFRYHLRGKKAADRIVTLLEMVGISDPRSRMDNFPHELSGGMMQRVMIAMALLAEPDLLIADEPTTALDVTIQAQILSLIRDLRKKNAMSLLLITHNLGVVAEMCDRIAVMYAGRIVEEARARDLFALPRHPYTHGLLQSIPRPGMDRSHPLPTIEGSVPVLTMEMKGCPFAERCFRLKQIGDRTEKCRRESPELASCGTDHRAACHYPLERGANHES